MLRYLSSSLVAIWIWPLTSYSDLSPAVLFANSSSPFHLDIFAISTRPKIVKLILNLQSQLESSIGRGRRKRKTKQFAFVYRRRRKGKKLKSNRQQSKSSACKHFLFHTCKCWPNGGGSIKLSCFFASIAGWFKLVLRRGGKLPTTMKNTLQSSNQKRLFALIAFRPHLHLLGCLRLSMHKVMMCTQKKFPLIIFHYLPQVQ